MSTTIQESRTWSTTHRISAEDKTAMSAMRVIVEPNKGRLRGTAARRPFDAIMERVAAPAGSPSSLPKGPDQSRAKARLLLRALLCMTGCWPRDKQEGQGRDCPRPSRPRRQSLNSRVRPDQSTFGGHLLKLPERDRPSGISLAIWLLALVWQHSCLTIGSPRSIPARRSKCPESIGSD